MPRSSQAARIGAPSAAAPRQSLLSAAHYAELVGALHDGAQEQPPWRRALDLLRTALDAAHVALVLRPPSTADGGAMITLGTEVPDARRSYEQHFFALDPFVRLRDGEVCTPEELIGEAWLDSAIYRDYLRPLDVRYLLGADIYTDAGIECRLRATRAHGSQPFSAEDKALVQRLLPHLKRAIALHARMDSLQCEREMFAGTVDRLLVGVVSLAQDGSIVAMNDEARRIVHDGDGLWLSASGLAAQNLPDHRELQRLIRQVLGHESTSRRPGLAPAMPVARQSGRNPYVVLVRPVNGDPQSDPLRRSAVTVYLRDPDAIPASRSIDLVRRLFGLTRVESRLALQLADGYSLDEAATHLGIRRNTARTHLRSIFSKTGVTRQTILVRNLLQSVYALA